MSVGPPCGKVLIQFVTTMDECTSAIFPSSAGNSLFGQIWSTKKIKIVNLRCNLIPSLIQIYRIRCLCSFFSFLIGITPSGQIWSKKSNCQLKLKFGTQTNSSMQNSVVVFIHFIRFTLEIPFLDKLGPKLSV